MFPLLFWYFWQYPYLCWLGILGLLLCIASGAYSYRLSVRARYHEVTRHLKKDGKFGRVANLFSSKLLSTIFIWVFFLAPNFITFWMYLGKTNIAFWLFFILLPFVFIIFKKTSGIHDSNRMIRLASVWLAIILALPLALLEAWIGGDSQIEILSGGNDVLKLWSSLYGFISGIKHQALFKIFEWFPWAEFLVTFIFSSFEYFGVFFILCLMLHAPRKHLDHRESILQTSKALFKDKKAQQTLSIFSIIVIIFVITRMDIQLSEEEKQEYFESFKQTSISKPIVEEVSKVQEAFEETSRLQETLEEMSRLQEKLEETKNLTEEMGECGLMMRTFDFFTGVAQCKNRKKLKETFE